MRSGNESSSCSPASAWWSILSSPATGRQLCAVTFKRLRDGLSDRSIEDVVGVAGERRDVRCDNDAVGRSPRPGGIDGVSVAAGDGEGAWLT
jgi:hypothetical protein